MTKGLTYITLLTALALVGCAKVDIQKEEQTELRFSTYSSRLSGTKAGSSFIGPGETFTAGDTIVVYGFYHANSGSADGSWAAETAAGTNKPDFMFDQNVIKQEDGSWAYSPLKYWPNSYGTGANSTYKDKLSFWAYYPEHAASKGLSLYAAGTSSPYSNTTSGLPEVVFTQSTDSDNMIDLMMAAPLKDLYKTQTHTVDEATWSYGAITNGQVLFTFKHALTLVEFRIADGCGAIVHSLSLTKICKTGTISDPSAVPFSWEASNNGNDATISLSNELDVNDPNILSILAIPQGLDADATLTLNYDIKFPSMDPNDDDPYGEDAIIYSDNNVSVKLFRAEGDENDYGVTEWLPGKHYIYYIYAGLERIEFEEIVSGDWEDWNALDPEINVPD